MHELQFRSTLDRDNDGTWWYVHVPADVRRSLRAYEKRGAIRVDASIGQTHWAASLLPWADGSAQLVIKKTVRERESLALGDVLEVRVTPR